jgi:hypothetical protein
MGTRPRTGEHPLVGDAGACLTHVMQRTSSGEGGIGSGGAERREHLYWRLGATDALLWDGGGARRHEPR